MKFFKIFLVIIVVIIAILFIGSLFLPKTYSVGRTISIAAPDSVIYRNIADFNEFGKWNPWLKKEPSAKVTVSGTVAAPDHLYQWEGKEVGSGQMRITAVKPYELVSIELKFIKPFESIAETHFYITKDGEQNKVTWTMSGKNENVFRKWMSLMMDRMIGKDFEEGLLSLKEKSEK